jgi:hypothetical protein
MAPVSTGETEPFAHEARVNQFSSLDTNDAVM